jgi:hypothetical protein
MSSLVTCRQQISCFLYDTDSDEEQTCDSVVKRSVHDRKLPSFVPSHDEIMFAMNRYPHLPIHPKCGSPLDKMIFDISSYKMNSLQHDIECTFEFGSPSETIEEIIWKQFDSYREMVDKTDIEPVELLKILEVAVSSFTRELGIKKRHVIPVWLFIHLN